MSCLAVGVVVLRARRFQQRAKAERAKMFACTKEDLLRESIKIEQNSVRYSIPREDSMVAKPPKANRFSQASDDQRETAVSIRGSKTTVVDLIEAEDDLF